MNRLFLLLFVSGALLSMMALMPEGQKEAKDVMAYDEAVERTPSNEPFDPASGEPSDNGLTQNLHRQFRETLNRDPAAAVSLAKEYVFTKELDKEFRREVLRDLKSVQFTEPGVFDLAGEIIEKHEDVVLLEEALNIKSAIMSEEEFGMLLVELSGKRDSPEIHSVIRKF